MVENKLMDAAIRYAEHGFYVLPIAPNAKVPAVKSYKDTPAWTPAEVKDFWIKHPNYNIALRTVNHFVIDVDTPEHAGTTKINGYDAFNRIPKDLLPPTTVERTGSGGMHLYYQKPSNFNLEPAQMLGWLPGIDIKAHINNYSLVAPSVSSNGKPYHWLNHLPMAVAPQSLIDYIQKVHDNAQRQTRFNSNQSENITAQGNYSRPKWTGQLINEIAEPHEKGNRNDTIATLSGKMIRAGADPQAIYTILQDVNRRFFKETSDGSKISAPLSEIELKKTFISIMKDEAKNHGSN